MLTRRLTLAVIATAFAASSSLAMLQNAGPAAARPHDHWRHHEHHQRFDRDDRRPERQVYVGSWHRHHRHANPSYANGAYANNGYVYNGYNGYVYNGNVYNGYVNPVYYVPGYVNTATYYTPQDQQHRYANRSWNPHYAWTRPHHDRDDRHWRPAHPKPNRWNGNNGWHGNHNGWNNPHNPHDAGYHGHGKPHIDPWRDHR